MCLWATAALFDAGAKEANGGAGVSEKCSGADGQRSASNSRGAQAVLATLKGAVVDLVEQLDAQQVSTIALALAKLDDTSLMNELARKALDLMASFNGQVRRLLQCFHMLCYVFCTPCRSFLLRQYNFDLIGPGQPRHCAGPLRLLLPTGQARVCHRRSGDRPPSLLAAICNHNPHCRHRR